MQIELKGHYTQKRLVQTVVPSILMVLISSVYGVVDGLFVSNFAGKTPFAAINLVWPAIMVVSSLGVMVGVGGSALVAKIKGEGDDVKADKVFSMLIEFSVAVGLVLGILSFVFMPQIVDWLGSDQQMAYYSILYGRMLAAALPFSILQMTFTPFFMTAERPDLGTKFTIICGLVNIVLDAIFIGWLHWGIAGAAAATIASQMVGSIGPLLYFSTKRNHSSLRIKITPIELLPIKRACVNGSSEFVANISFSVVSMCYNWQLMQYLGQAGVAAYGIIMYAGMIFYSIVSGFNIGVSPIIAYNYGANDRTEMHSLLKHSLIIMGVIDLVCLVSSELSAPLVARIFVGYDPELLQLTTVAFRIYMISFLFSGYNAFTSAFFTSLNNGVVSAVLSFTRFVFEVASIFILPLLLGSAGIWISVVLSETFAILLSGTAIITFRKRYGY